MKTEDVIFSGSAALKKIFVSLNIASELYLLQSPKRQQSAQADGNSLGLAQRG
jgi:hypothetical protein